MNNFYKNLNESFEAKYSPQTEGKALSHKKLKEDVYDANYRALLTRINRALMLLETYVDYSQDYTYSKQEDKKILDDGYKAIRELKDYIKQ